MQFPKSSLIVALAATTALAACTDPGRFEPDYEQNNTRAGAIMGGIVGGLIGMANGDNPADRRGDAVRGAIIGATAGAVIGTQLDQQAAALEASMANSGVSIENTGESLIVTLPQDILFDTDSTAIRLDLAQDLTALARNLNDYPDSTVQIIGHTDNVGSASYNQDLSLRRALAVSNILAAEGVLVSRISTVGMGESQPVSTNLTESGRAQNRRVEIIIVPNA